MRFAGQAEADFGFWILNFGWWIAAQPLWRSSYALCGSGVMQWRVARAEKKLKLETGNRKGSSGLLVASKW
jgi:hypothetical protein